MRLASIEFYEKKSVDENFDISSELTILKSVFALTLVPVELVLVFAYSRLCGSVALSPLMLAIVLMLLNRAIAIPLVNRMRDLQCIEDTLKRYRELDYASRKKRYSVKNIILFTLLYAILPWVFMGICLFLLYRFMPR